MDISDRKKFRIQENIIKNSFGNVIKTEYVLQIRKGHLFFKKWVDYEFRVAHCRILREKDDNIFDIRHDVYRFSSLEDLKKFFRDYSEKSIYYNNYPIYTYCSTFGKILYISTFSTNGSSSLEEIKHEIDEFDAYRKTKRVTKEINYI